MMIITPILNIIDNIAYIKDTQKIPIGIMI